MSPRPFLPQHPDLCLSSLCTLSFPLLPRGHISNLATLTDVLIYAPPPDRPKRILCSLIELNWTPMARHLPDIAKKSSHDKKTTQYAHMKTVFQTIYYLTICFRVFGCRTALERANEICTHMVNITNDAGEDCHLTMQWFKLRPTLFLRARSSFPDYGMSAKDFYEMMGILKAPKSLIEDYKKWHRDKEGETAFGRDDLHDGCYCHPSVGNRPHRGLDSLAPSPHLQEPRQTTFLTPEEIFVLLARAAKYGRGVVSKME